MVRMSYSRYSHYNCKFSTTRHTRGMMAQLTISDCSPCRVNIICGHDKCVSFNIGDCRLVILSPKRTGFARFLIQYRQLIFHSLYVEKDLHQIIDLGILECASPERNNNGLGHLNVVITIKTNEPGGGRLDIDIIPCSIRKNPE